MRAGDMLMHRISKELAPDFRCNQMMLSHPTSIQEQPGHNKHIVSTVETSLTLAML
jgi:hypothetical protein